MLGFDIADAVAFMEAAASVVAVLSDADVVAADGAPAKLAFVVPVPEVHWVFLADDACVEGCINVDFDFTIEFSLDIVDFVKSIFILIGCRS